MQSTFGVSLTDEPIERLADYHALVQAHNPILHLVGPCSPEEFATRHILESLTLLKFLTENARFADVGAGAGLPSIPCLIARADLFGVLIESKEKKVRFLETAVERCGLSGRVELVNRQFSEAPRPDALFVTCRALDKFAENLDRLLKWSGGRNLLFFGGPAMKEELEKRKLQYESYLMPLSTQRYLFEFRSPGPAAG